MDVQSSHLKLFVIVFAIIVVLGAGMSLRATYFANNSPNVCPDTASITTVPVSAESSQPIISSAACE
ncbi:MAG TPA: hypothetical protein VK978_03300 [Candidatus Saccharimonadales bacterium]|nr:hypothetical protein [Candidatus Saccharimonadales bacterium]